jgi:hypothetical protein
VKPGQLEILAPRETLGLQVILVILDIPVTPVILAPQELLVILPM